MKDRERLREETTGFVRRGDWWKAGPEHFVQLFEDLHEQVYGVPAEVLEVPGARGRAKRYVSRVLEESFGGDAGALADFVRWVWLREKEAERWRKENRRDGGHLTWRTAFDRERITGYRIALARRRA